MHAAAPDAEYLPERHGAHVTSAAVVAPAAFVPNFPAAQTLVLRSDDLFEDPAGAFGQTLDFLGLAPWAPEAFRVHNPGTNRREVPEDVRAFLDAHYAPHNERLGALLGPEFDWSAA